MMSSCRNIIRSFNSSHQEFEYYISIIEEIENNQDKNPDISIESAKSLIEGVSKSILLRLDISQTIATVNKMDFQEIFRNACWRLRAYVFIEDDFIYRTSAMVQRIAEIRNNRGDISHGKAVPKLEMSTSESAKMIMQITDAIVHYMLIAFSKIDLSYKEEIIYEDNADFNEVLDEAFTLPNIKYSRALFDQDIVAYEEQLKDYLDIRNEEEDEPAI